MFTFAQLSDPHLDNGPHARARTERVVAYLRPFVDTLDAVLVTGDLAEHGRAWEYQEFAEVFDLPCPVLVLPGNHDVREPFREVLLGEPPTGEPINAVRDVGGVRFALCDSTIPGRHEGTLTDETLVWLDSVLGDGPSFVCFHHPPVVLHHPYVDSIRQFEVTRLAEVVERHPGVRAVLCGHAHTAAASTFAGRPLVVCPGIVSTLLTPMEERVMVEEPPPGLALHFLDDGRLTTHYRAVTS